MTESTATATATTEATDDFSTVTETVGDKITEQALTMIRTRYEFAAEYSKDKDVLEAGCGVGQGLGILGRDARRVVGGDYTASLVEDAKRHYGDRFEVSQFDAQEMPFEDDSFDVVILYEAIYYLPEPKRFLVESRRVLRPDGVLLICTANCAGSDFHPSSHSLRYFTAEELDEMMRAAGFHVKLFGAFSRAKVGLVRRAVSLLKRIAVKLNVMPKTMKGKELLKRLFLGKLVEVPAEVDESMGSYERPVELSSESNAADYKVIYALGRVR